MRFKQPRRSVYSSFHTRYQTGSNFEIGTDWRQFHENLIIARKVERFLWLWILVASNIFALGFCRWIRRNLVSCRGRWWYMLWCKIHGRRRSWCFVRDLNLFCSLRRVELFMDLSCRRIIYALSQSNISTDSWFSNLYLQMAVQWI